MSSEPPMLALDLAQVIEHMNEGLQIIGPDFRYLYLNRVAAKHGQRPREELLGRTMMEAYPGIEATPLFEHIRGVLHGGGAMSIENEFTFPDGSSGFFDLRMARVTAGVMILSIDVTPRKRMELQMRRMQRMDAIGQLAAGIAHDFNNILTVIQSYAQFIRDDLPPEDAMRADADCVLDAAQRAADLTHQLLTFAGRMPAFTGTVTVERALNQLGKMLRRTLGTQVELTIEVDPGLGEVSIDPTAFDQVLMNLVVNARDAVGVGGRVTVEAERVDVQHAWGVGRGAVLEAGQYVVVSVTDSGDGIPPDHIERIFEPFFTTKSEGRGTGLGLATCWGLVEQAGGAITVYSELGIGTTFRVYLPHSTKRVEVLTAPVAATAESRGECVLVVEDEPKVRELLGRTLGSSGYRVTSVESVVDAQLAVENASAPFDLLVTDVVLQRVSGVELAAQLRARFPEMKVLLVSGFTPRWLAQSHLLNALPVLVKPFTAASFVAAVRAALDAPG